MNVVWSSGYRLGMSGSISSGVIATVSLIPLRKGMNPYMHPPAMVKIVERARLV